MKKVLIGVAVLVLLLIAAAIATPFLISKEWVVAVALEQVKAKTGRDATVKGPIKLGYFPLQIDASDVALANVPGGTAPNMATAKTLKLDLQIMPLLSGRIAVDSFVLTEPVIALEVDRQGRPNWSFAQAAAEGRPVPGAPAAPPPAGTAGRIQQIEFGDLRLVNGTISYADARSGTKQSVSGIDAVVTLPDLDSPAGIKGNLTWNGKKIDVTANAGKARSLMTGERTDLAFTLGADVVKLAFKGNATLAARPDLGGTIDLDIPSLRNLAAWTGAPIAFDRPNTLGPLKISGKVTGNAARAGLTEATIALDAIKARGDLVIDLAAAHPALKGKLDVDRLDLNPYLPPEKSGPANTQGGGGPGGAAAARNAGWNTEPLDFSALRALEADLVLSAGSLQYRKIAVGKAVLGVKAHDGRVTADLSQLALYEGTATGSLTVDGSTGTPGVALVLKLAGVQADPFLRDAIAFERLAGRITGEIDVNARGVTQKAMIEAMGGKGALRFNDGLVKGIDLVAMVRNVSTAFLDGGSGGQRTDFSELGGTFTIARGVLTNNDLAMNARLVQLRGTGVIDLPRQTLRYRVEPEIARLEGITVPVVIEGPWSGISYKPDLTALLRDPSRTIDALRNLGQGNEGGGGLLPGILGGGRSGETGSGSGGGLPTQLRGLFGR